MEHKNTSRRAMIHGKITYIWAKSIICQPILDLPTGIYILLTIRHYLLVEIVSREWSSQNGSSLWFQRVMFEAFALSLSLSFPYTHHDFELMFTAFWDFDVQLTPMLLKTRWTANHTPRFLQQKKAWIWYQPWPKTPSSTMGWFLDMKKPRNQYGKRMKKVHMVGQVHGCC